MSKENNFIDIIHKEMEDLKNGLQTDYSRHLEQENAQLKQQLAEKDKEIESLEKEKSLTNKLYINAYTQLQNYRSKLYGVKDILALRKKKLTPEEKEIYYKGFENCERQISSRVSDIKIELRHEICEKIREYLKYNNGQEWILMLDETVSLNELLDKIEKGGE